MQGTYYLTLKFLFRATIPIQPGPGEMADSLTNETSELKTDHSDSIDRFVADKPRLFSEEKENHTGKTILLKHQSRHFKPTGIFFRHSINMYI